MFLLEGRLHKGSYNNDKWLVFFDIREMLYQKKSAVYIKKREMLYPKNQFYIYQKEKYFFIYKRNVFLYIREILYQTKSAVYIKKKEKCYTKKYLYISKKIQFAPKEKVNCLTQKNIMPYKKMWRGLGQKSEAWRLPCLRFYGAGKQCHGNKY